MKSDLESALDHLPHGPEFRFIDRLVELEPGVRGAGEYHVRGDEAFLKGHFPGRPLVPGVVLIEAVAQLAGTVAQCDPEAGPLADLRLAAVRAAKILGTASPGQTLRVKANVTGRFENLVQASGEVEVDGQTILRAEVVLSGESDRRPVSQSTGA